MRYFFHFLAGNSRLDDDHGLSYDTPKSARADAIRAAREMIADLLRRNSAVPADGSIEISDESGRLIDCVSLAEAAFEPSPEHRYRRIFEHSPLAYLLLTPDFTIIEANRAYLRATMTDLGSIVGRCVFDVFPDNPGDPEANGVRNLTAALNAVVRDKAENRMPVQRYDIRRPDGAWEVRYWRPTKVPVLDHNGDVEFILYYPDVETLRWVSEASRGR
jgi:PAS domain-containing protein